MDESKTIDTKRFIDELHAMNMRAKDECRQIVNRAEANRDGYLSALWAVEQMLSGTFYESKQDG